MSDKQRTISYLRSVWTQGGDANTTFYEVIERALRTLPNAPDTRLAIGDKNAEVRHRLVRNNRACLHVAGWREGEAASTVPHPAPTPAAHLQSLAPDQNYDFLKGDGMVLVSDNHCLLMSSGLHPKSMQRYLLELLGHARERGARIPEEVRSIRFLPIADPQAIDRVYEGGGIKKVDMNVGRYLETSLDYEEQHETIVRRIGRTVLESLFTDDATRRRVEDADNVNAKLTISLDSRRPGLTGDELAELAQTVVDENEDDVDIVTAQGQRIRRGELVLTKRVLVAGFGQTVHHNDAWDEMKDYLSELEASGYLNA